MRSIIVPDTAPNYHLIADSFPEFLACLYETVEDPNAEKKGEGGKEAPGNEGILEELTRRKDAETGKR